jgi:hypothetical protein
MLEGATRAIFFFLLFFQSSQRIATVNVKKAGNQDLVLLLVTLAALHKEMAMIVATHYQHYGITQTVSYMKDISANVFFSMFIYHFVALEKLYPTI